MKKEKYFLLIAICIPLILGISRWSFHDYDISTFIVAGSDINADSLPYKIKIVDSPSGYDGRIFYLLALNPFTIKNKEYGINNGLAYRKGRIGYPFLAYILSFGNGEYVPWTLVIVNLFSFALFFYFCKKILKELKLPAWHLFLFVLLPGVYLAFARDLAELVALTCIAGSFLFLLKEKLLLFLFFVTGALLTREESILVLFPTVLFYGIRHQKLILNNLRFENLWLGIPFVLFLLWKAHIYFSFGGHNSLLEFIPFKGVFEGISNNLTLIAELESSTYPFFAVYFALLFIWYMVTFIYAGKYLTLKEKSFNGLLSWCWVIWFLFFPFLNSSIFMEDWSFGRVLATFTFISLLMICMNSKKINPLYIGGAILVFTLVAVRIVFTV